MVVNLSLPASGDVVGSCMLPASSSQHSGCGTGFWLLWHVHDSSHIVASPFPSFTVGISIWPSFNKQFSFGQPIWPWIFFFFEILSGQNPAYSIFLLKIRPNGHLAFRSIFRVLLLNASESSRIRRKNHRIEED